MHLAMRMQLSSLAVQALCKELKMPFMFFSTRALKHILSLASLQVADDARVTDSF